MKTTITRQPTSRRKSNHRQPGRRIVAASVLFCLGAAILLSAYGEDPLEAGLSAISATDLGTHIERLASDEFEGRGPSSPGEEKTVAYLRDQFASLGLVPGNGESYYQDVPLVAITANTPTPLTISRSGVRRVLRPGVDYMAWTKRVVAEAGFDRSQLVFVGYGINAPEYGWNDYEGLDVAGKTAWQSPQRSRGSSVRPTTDRIRCCRRPELSQS